MHHGITVRGLIRDAARITGVRTADIYGPSRTNIICTIRSAIYTVAKEAGHSYSAISRVFARDHSTIINGCDKFDIYVRRFPQVVQLVGLLRSGEDGSVSFDKPDPSTARRGEWADWEREKLLRLVRAGASDQVVASSLNRDIWSIRYGRKRISRPHSKWG